MYSVESTHCTWAEPQRRKGERGNSDSRSALSAGEYLYTTTFLMMVTLSTPLLLCPSNILDKATKILFSFVIVHSLLFNNVI
jgi:hypothetical protein